VTASRWTAKKPSCKATQCASSSSNREAPRCGTPSSRSEECAPHGRPRTPRISLTARSRTTARTKHPRQSAAPRQAAVPRHHRRMEDRTNQVVRRVITKLRPVTAYQTPKRDLRIGRPPRSAKTATTRIANTHTQVVRAMATAALHSTCPRGRAMRIQSLTRPVSHPSLVQRQLLDVSL
jgi:hypothetical protein